MKTRRHEVAPLRLLLCLGIFASACAGGRDGESTSASSSALSLPGDPPAGGAPGDSGAESASSADGGVQPSVYVSPSGDDSHSGTASSPVQSLQRAQALVRALNSNMTSDVTVVLADGYYRMKSSLVLDPRDSGTNGHDVVWTAAAGARPAVIGSVAIGGWTQLAGSSTVWVAQGPAGIQTRQLYVDGVRATRASGAVPTATALASWRDPSGGFPPRVEFVFTGGAGAWTEPRCPVASVASGQIVMAQPC